MIIVVTYVSAVRGRKNLNPKPKQQTLAVLCLWFGARFQSYLLWFPPSHCRPALNRRFLIFAGLHLGALMSDYFCVTVSGRTNYRLGGWKLMERFDFGKCKCKPTIFSRFLGGLKHGREFRFNINSTQTRTTLVVCTVYPTGCLGTSLGQTWGAFCMYSGDPQYLANMDMFDASQLCGYEESYANFDGGSNGQSQLPYSRNESDNILIWISYSRHESDNFLIQLPYSLKEVDNRFGRHW